MGGAILLTVVVIGMLAFCIWGLLHPGKIKWKRSPVPVSPGALAGAMIFVSSLTLAVVIERIGLIHDEKVIDVIVWVLIAIALGGWVLALVTGVKDMRRYRALHSRDPSSAEDDYFGRRR